MYRKDYRDHIELLRSREAFPSFVRMEALVAGAPIRDLKTIPFFAKVFGSLLGIGVIGAAFWTHTSKAPLNETPLSRGRVETNSPKYAVSQPPPKFAAHNIIRVRESSTSRFQIPSRSPIPGSSASAHAADSELLRASSPLPNTVIVPSPIAHDTRPASSIAIADPEKGSNSNFCVTLGGTLSQQFSSNSSYRQTSFSDAFLGVGYDLSQNSSVRILAGEEAFNTPSNTTTNSISFHDTTFVHNGQTYQNVIGGIQSANVPVLTRVYWLGASYRFTLGDDASAIRPFAEVMAGGSTDGFLTHQSLGAEFTVTNTIDLDLLFDASELLPQNSTWLTKAGFAAELSYRW